MANVFANQDFMVNSVNRSVNRGFSVKIVNLNVLAINQKPITVMRPLESVCARRRRLVMQLSNGLESNVKVFAL
jgi:hypothetical protein